MTFSSGTSRGMGLLGKREWMIATDIVELCFMEADDIEDYYFTPSDGAIK